MTEYDNTNRFTLFKNDKKQQDTHADYQGTINIKGTEFYLNAWLKEGKSGKFFSGSIGKEKGAKPTTDRVAESKPTQSDDPFGDDVPF